MRNEFHRAVEFTHWNGVRDEHARRVRSEVIAELSKKLGQSTGGRWAVCNLTLKRLRALHQSPPDRTQSDSWWHPLRVCTAGEGLDSYDLRSD